MRTTLTVASYNIHHGAGVDGRLDLQRTADLLRRTDPDVVGIQEVDRRFRPRSQFADQLDVLSEELGMETAFAPIMEESNERGPDDLPGQYGIGLLTDHSIVDSEILRLSETVESEPRVLLNTVVEIDDGPTIDVSTTHLALGRSLRERQARELVAATSGTTASVLVGDFNDTPDSPPVSIVREHFTDALRAVGSADQPTFPSPYASPGEKRGEYDLSVPWGRIDYVFASPDVGVEDAHVVESLASDHSLVVADLSVPT
jgi:endonuclease/exonuclease/phosphatase family metal-dependent hydrolase